MGFKIGDEVVIEGKVIGTDGNLSKYPITVEFKDKNYAVFNENCLILADKTYEQGLKDAWELVKKMINKDWTFADVRDCFGLDVNLKTGVEVAREIFNIPYHEALARFEAYKKEKEIKVGDVIRLRGVEAVVTCIYPDGKFDGLKITADDKHGRLGGAYAGYSLSSWEKTGNHIDLSSILAEIGKE